MLLLPPTDLESSLGKSTVPPPTVARLYVHTDSKLHMATFSWRKEQLFLCHSFWQTCLFHLVKNFFALVVTLAASDLARRM